MTETEAHEFFFRKHNAGDTAFFPHTVELITPASDGDPEVRQDIWPSGCVAAAAMVGWLDDAKTEQDLLDALEHFDSCVGIEIGGFTLEDWEAESQRVAVRFMEALRTSQGAA